jgi:membrane protease YdiL (CAAX protease family)
MPQKAQCTHDESGNRTEVNVDISMSSAEIWIPFPVLAIGYTIYWYAVEFPFLRSSASFLRRRLDSWSEQELGIYLQKFFGFLLMGVVPFLLVVTLLPPGPAAYGLGLPGKGGLLWFVILTVAGIIFIFARPKRSIDTTAYPQVRQNVWHGRRLSMNTGMWLLYLIGYEFAFRGFLFFPCVRAFGFWNAMWINVLAYTFAHIPKNFQESLGAFVYGILLCVVAYDTHSIWIPVWAHLMLALANDYSAVAENPEMTFRFHS